MIYKKIIKYLFIIVGLFLIASRVHALEALEVTTIFFNNDRSLVFHQDVDQNILELSRNNIENDLSIAVFRELSSYDYFYRPQGKGNGISANSLFSVPYFEAQFKVPGTFQRMSIGSLEKIGFIEKILKNNFKNSESLKILFLYGHGVGPTGFKDKDLNLLKNEILNFIRNNNGQKIDLIVYDSCFLGNIEFLYEMRDLSKFSMASSESEFSQGQPFEVIDSLLSIVLSEPKRELATKKLALELLLKFLSSYSTLENGKNAKTVTSSSAVFSIFDNSKFEFLMNDLGKLRVELNHLSAEQQIRLNKKWKKYSMDDDKLLDLGGFLKILNAENISSEITALSKNILLKLNITESDFKSVSPMVQFRSPLPNSALAILSVNNKNQEDIQRLLPSLKNQVSTPFTRKGEVALEVKKVLKISPFLPHIQTIEVRFIDPKTGNSLGEIKSVKRDRDLKIHENKINSPIQFFGFTESQKTIEKRYSGLNISHPFRAMPNFDYMNLEFQTKIGWLK